MTKILFFHNNSLLDRNVLRPTNYFNFESEWKRQGGGNVGNKLFSMAVEQYITKKDIEYEYYNESMLIEEINEKFDMVICSGANCFAGSARSIYELEEETKFIKKLKIPFYMLGGGISCASYDDINSLAKAIYVPVKNYLEAIYESGGELALRGFATKELLDMIVPNTAVVTGCPAFYQLGSSLNIPNEKVDEKYFKPLINGSIRYLKSVGVLPFLETYRNSIFMDQNEFAPWLYFRKLYGKENSIYELIFRNTFVGAKLLVENRIKLIYDVPVWIRYMRNEKFSFSYGTRIHGNIAAMLAGVPSKVLAYDARTRELAEFFEIPYSLNREEKTLYQIYMDCDYESFNKNFSKKFYAFEKFLTSHGISYEIDDRSLFTEKINCEKWNMPIIVGQANIDYIQNKLWGHENYYRFVEKLADEMRKMKNRTK